MHTLISPVNSLRGSLNDLPADKSIAHRAALFAGISRGKSIISNYSLAADPQSTLSCLRQLGVRIETAGNGAQVEIHGKGRHALKPVASEDGIALLDCGNSGTTMRLLSGIVAGANMQITLTGDASLRSRPMKRVLDPLHLMGAACSTDEGSAESQENPQAPLYFEKHSGLSGVRYELPVASAQVKSCLLLAGLYASGETEVVEFTPSRDHTERMLGLETQYNADGSRIIKSSREVGLEGFDMRIPGDISGAAFWMVAGSILGDADIRIPHVGVNPSRAAVIDILKRMDADVQVFREKDQEDQSGQNASGEPVANLQIRPSRLKATEILRSEVPNAIDEIPVLAVAMCFASGRSGVRNAKELRKKETDRISAVVEMIERAGGTIEELEDGFEIEGNPSFVPRKASYNSYHDHRIAMAASILALKAEAGQQSTIEDSECVDISYPNFYEHLRQLTKS
jgi:3-phosphoshikimate 1-carboxyvinyltransferase